MSFVCIVFELGDKMLTFSSMENLIVQCNHLMTQIKKYFKQKQSCMSITAKMIVLPLI